VSIARPDVHELLNLVGAIEGLAAYTASLDDHGGRARLVEVLEAANAEFLEAVRTDATGQTRLFEADEHFHGAIVRAGGGPRVRALHEAVKPQAERYIRMYISLLAADVTRSSGEHERIIRADIETFSGVVRLAGLRPDLAGDAKGGTRQAAGKGGGM
jgi:DNA-binding GntR family transcriptional regulator